MPDTPRSTTNVDERMSWLSTQTSRIRSLLTGIGNSSVTVAVIWVYALVSLAVEAHDAYSQDVKNLWRSVTAVNEQTALQKEIANQKAIETTTPIGSFASVAINVATDGSGITLKAVPVANATKYSAHWRRQDGSFSGAVILGAPTRDTDGFDTWVIPASEFGTAWQTGRQIHVQMTASNGYSTRTSMWVNFRP